MKKKFPIYKIYPPGNQKKTNILKSVLEMDILVPSRVHPRNPTSKRKKNGGLDQNVFPSNQKRAMFTWDLGGPGPSGISHDVR